MTCIVGHINITKEGIRKITFGSDSGIYYHDMENDPDNSEFHSSSDPKIHKKSFNNGKNEFLAGAAGDNFETDAFDRIDFTKLKATKKDAQDPAQFMKTKFVPFLKEELKKLNSEGPELMIGIFGQLFYLDGQMAAIQAPSHGFAIGSAALPARSALFAISKIEKKMNPLRIVKIALETAENNDIFCRSPFTYLEL